MRLLCPYCGLRDHDEFDYGGDASVAYPALDAGTSAWFDAVYLRDDPEGVIEEYWRHARGCGLWVIVRRDTRTHDVLGVRAAHPGLAAETAAPPETAAAPNPALEPIGDRS